jgi:CO/xanthine dehydrogenase FAD-binding subunit
MLQQVFVPQDVGDAVARLTAGPGAAFIAGGTLLMPAINTTPADVQTLVSARRLGLAGIEVVDGRAMVGAATTLAAFGRDPRLAILWPVSESIAAPPIRNLATVGGNLFAPQPYGDLAVALLALDAIVGIVGPNGARQAPVADVLEGGVAPGEIVTSVSFDVPASGTWFYRKAMRRKLNSAAIVTVAASIVVEDGTARAARIALGGAWSRPIRARSAEAALIGRPLDAAAVGEAAARAVEDAEPFTDAYASAWYRARVLPVHVRRAILGE